LIAREDDRDGNEMQRSESRVKLTMVMNNSEANKMWWKTIATELDATEQIRAEIH
jgi:hypothetical protein